MPVDTSVYRGGLHSSVNAKAVAGAANVTLLIDEARQAVQRFIGALTGNITITFPGLAAENAGLTWLVENATTGAFTLSVANAGGTALQIPQGQRVSVLWNGTAMVAADTGILTARVSLTAAQILDLADTPVELVAAPGAGKYLEFLGGTLFLDHAGTGFAETADNLEVHYENEAGPAASALIECTGFIDQTADTLIEIRPLATAVARAKTAVENKALVLTNINDDFTDAGTTTSTLRAVVRYRVLNSEW